MGCSTCGARRRVRVAQAAARQALIRQQRQVEQLKQQKPQPVKTEETPKSEPQSNDGADIQGGQGTTG